MRTRRSVPNSQALFTCLAAASCLAALGCGEPDDGAEVGAGAGNVATSGGTTAIDATAGAPAASGPTNPSDPGVSGTATGGGVDQQGAAGGGAIAAGGDAPTTGTTGGGTTGTTGNDTTTPGTTGTNTEGAGTPGSDGMIPSDTGTTPPASTVTPEQPSSGQVPSGGDPTAGTTDGTPADGAGGEEMPPAETLPAAGSGLGSGVMGGTGQSSDRWEKADVTRNDRNYLLMANGWGPGFGSQAISWNGTAFTIESMTGQQGSGYEPASYPTVFCGVYSDSQSQACGLPAAIDSLTSLRTGWLWEANGNDGEYNAAYDIWLANGTDRRSFSGFLMVWLREPIGQQPAGSRKETGVTVQNVPGTWDIWTGTVNNAPIVNWVRAEGDDSYELEFDVLDFVRDAQQRGIEVPGTHILSVAVGFEIWNGPVTNLKSLDFYVEPQ